MASIYFTLLLEELSGSELQACLRCDQVDGRQLLFQSTTSCGAGAPDTLDGRAEEREGQGTSQPGHGAAVGMIVFCGNH